MFSHPLSSRRQTTCAVFPRRAAVTQLKERSLDYEKKNCGCRINAKFDHDKSGKGCERNVVACAELPHKVDDEFLYQVGAVGDAGDERCARNRNSTEKRARTDHANQKGRHANCDQWKLPDAGSDGEMIAFTQIQSVSYYRESR